MKLLIVESPTKAKKIASFLGGDFVVRASLGHIRDLPKRDLGVSMEDYSLTYVYREPSGPGKTGGKEIVKRLRDDVRNADVVYLATDPDREGESIAWHLADELRLKKPLRVKYHEVTKGAVESAIAEAGQIDMALVHAQEARRALDRLVGYRVSPVLGDLIGQPASAGRVQTPALRLVVDRAREISSFVSREHYGVELLFAGGWSATWDFRSQLADGEKLWTRRDVAEAVATVRDVVVVKCEDTEATSAPSPAFTTSTLQQAASVRLKLRPQETMRLAQALFEGGHITYHRTDDPNLSTTAIDAIRALAQANGWDIPARPRTWKARGGAQEAHEGIRPTHLEAEVAGSSDDERALYRLIRLRAIASQLADARYDVRTAVLRSTAPAIGGQPADFVASGRVLRSPGWRAIVGDSVSESESADEEQNNPVPRLVAGAQLVAENGGVKVKHTKPPALFTEAALIKELERLEIGRPSTYASICSTLDRRAYVVLDKSRRLSPTKLGEVVRDALIGRFSFGDYSFTSMIERHLDKIASGQSTYSAVVQAQNIILMKELEELLHSNVERVKRDGPQCPTCKEGVLVRKKGNYGHFWSCDAYRRNDCKGTFRDVKGKPDFTPRAPVDPNAPTCPSCGKGKLVARNGKNGVFYGCTEFRNGNCKAAYDRLPEPAPT